MLILIKASLSPPSSPPSSRRRFCLDRSDEEEEEEKEEGSAGRSTYRSRNKRSSYLNDSDGETTAKACSNLYELTIGKAAYWMQHSFELSIGSSQSREVGILIFTGAVIIVCTAMFSDPAAGMNPGPLDPHNVFLQRAPLGFMRAASVLQDDYSRD
ncbi:hypothetical protein DPX16_6544 [Anabarilius grahami]|uniref:Uncharacterized protein n=1 Tax=Anabarilius grahami TaxID=495550 RepID=A0A3N0XYG5_ANAGA|nr:hypothetical protein DPX16_6544 [Anabarilius grahami]